MPSPLVFMDTETTGLAADREVWEFGAVRREADGTQREKQFFIKVDLAFADPFGLAVGRFYQRSPQGQYLSGKGLPPENLWTAPTNWMLPETAAPAIARFLHGAHIVGAVPSFDTEVLGELLRNHDIQPAWHYHLLDVENLAVGYLRHELRWLPREIKHAERELVNTPAPTPAADLIRMQKAIRDLRLRQQELEVVLDPEPGKSWDSDALGRLLGVTVSDEDRHTALGDAKWAMRMYDAIMTRPQ